MKKALLLLLFLCQTIFYSQEYFPINSGVKNVNNSVTAFTNAQIHVSPTKSIKNGVLIIMNGRIQNVGSKIPIPDGAHIIDLSGKSVYPSFIDMYSNFGIEKPGRRPFSGSSAPQYDASRTGYYWNDHVRPETNPLKSFKFDDKKAKELLNAGFGVVNTHLQDGLVRGNGLLVSLNTNQSDAYRILDAKSAQYLSFRKGSISRQVYPTSLMGSMALFRQLYIDADWYARGMQKSKDLSLEAFNSNKGLVQIFEAGGKLNDLRVNKISKEFGVPYVVLGGGDEYENINEIKATNSSYIIPINFRKAYDVSDPHQASEISLSDMRKWNQEPTNLHALQTANIEFCLTTHSLASVSDFKKNLQKAITYGFSESSALASLTTIPAKLLGKENELGTLEKGKLANFLISSGSLFDKETTLYENWVQGNKTVINSMNIRDLKGDYTLSFDDNSYQLSIKGKPSKPTVEIKSGDKKFKSKTSYDGQWLTITISDQENSGKFIRLNGPILNDQTDLSGVVLNANGEASKWTAVKSESSKKVTAKKPKKKVSPTLVPITYPNKPYGFSEQPSQETLLFKNVTVWTNEEAGILKNSDVLIKDGKISKIGQQLKASGATIIDGTGKHLTAGIIDEHSHIAIEGGNEAGHNSSAEVTIEDIINPDAINIYQSLAGGVTSVQLLHGSANPIGGRSAIVKLKWGGSADDMLYDNSPKFIKFALGENVKQSRSTIGVRFPQTRMGVEKVFVDYFQRAKEYDARKKSGLPYRKDLEMETLAEILNKERFISCHSYVQSEINMLMKVADEFNFNVNTFTHILEGYKVADKMKAHGVGGSTFSDWWAYKYEVIDAIPYNAAIMHNVGITVAINSDDAEMQRRLNQEAAKSIKYGGISEEDALKFVTLNPAKLLHIDDRVGSIKIGKDADVVLWSEHPLSVYAKPEKTIIEGIVYFDIQRDLSLQQSVERERNLLMNLMLNEKINGGKVQAPSRKKEVEIHCDTVLQY